VRPVDWKPSADLAEFPSSSRKKPSVFDALEPAVLLADLFAIALATATSSV
jgi:hypothetical protein